ncbi:hypothetical protein [Epilithonimonas xixisoli]|uniref:Uncharacterized protein n=1 Tax=Epilithonimonas xixisoli TaxID=1476462 RepID=A0A4R8I8Q3_9FLAO|nr:hypothetical protein [Epilithonimonas xixisoli]TDX86054.1 hypothetical protein B0I22_0155 [Epilithonimonas xixisoli]
MTTENERIHLYFVQAINTWDNIGINENDENIISKFIEKRIPEKYAKLLLIYLPIILTRKIFNKINFPDEYIEMNRNLEISRNFSENNFFIVLKSSLDNYVIRNFKKDLIMKIAGRSAEFKVLNQFLLEGKEMNELQNIQFTKLHIIN